MIRAALYSDIPRLIELYGEIMEQGPYREMNVAVDREWAQRYLQIYIRNQWRQEPGGTFFVVSERAMRVEGFFLGFLERFHLFGDKLTAMELQFYTTEQAHTKDPMQMLNAFLRWTGMVEDIILVRIGTGLFTGDTAERLDRIYQRKGFRQVGALYEKELHHGSNRNSSCDERSRQPSVGGHQQVNE